MAHATRCALSIHPTKTRNEEPRRMKTPNDNSLALIGLLVSISGLILTVFAMGLALGLAL